MANENQRKTFLSYSRVNKDFAIKLAKELKSEGFNVWLDQLDIPAGSRWDREVEKALKECEIFMIILTSASVDSENVLDEIGYAIDGGKRFLPVLLEKCEVPFRLRRFQYVDFTNKSFDDGVESAKDLLRNLIAQTTVSRGVLSEPQDATTQADAERIAAQKAEDDRKARDEADHLAAQKAEADHLAAQRAESDRVAKQKAEDERLAKVKADADRKAKGEADHLATQKAESDRVAKQKAEDERLAKVKADADRKAKEESDRLVAQKAEADRVARQKVKDKPAPAQKKPVSKGLVIGIVVVAVLVVAGIGFRLLSNSNTPSSDISGGVVHYEIDCFDSSANSYNAKPISVFNGTTVVVSIKHCEAGTYKATGLIAPGSSIDSDINSITQFQVTGNAYLEIHGNKTFVWTFKEAP